MKQQLSGATVLLWQERGPSTGQEGALEKVVEGLVSVVSLALGIGPWTCPNMES
jgi:hypothetical protein